MYAAFSNMQLQSISAYSMGYLRPIYAIYVLRYIEISYVLHVLWCSVIVIMTSLTLLIVTMEMLHTKVKVL